MLKGFLEWWVHNTPDILTGWNVNLYDVPYIARRLNRILGEKWMRSLFCGTEQTREKFMFREGRIMLMMSVGLTFLTISIFIKFTYSNQESYRLDHIAFVELGQRKLDHASMKALEIFIQEIGRSL
ncbi:MAG: hypothetical protein CM15mV11_1670 [Caudoviricetes sp.]|nr:MAG: hypothetical protein CM15mV11_1670 [Caudoviricetes sp.]